MRSPNVLLAFVTLMGIAGALSPAGAAILVDGTLDSSNGPPAAFQNVQTNMGDNTWMFPDQANGSELDAAYGIVDGTTLYLFFTCNLTYYPQLREWKDREWTFVSIRDRMVGLGNAFVHTQPYG